MQSKTFLVGKTQHTFQVWSGLQLDTKNSLIHVIDCENCVCTVFVMQSKNLIRYHFSIHLNLLSIQFIGKCVISIYSRICPQPIRHGINMLNQFPDRTYSWSSPYINHFPRLLAQPETKQYVFNFPP